MHRGRVFGRFCIAHDEASRQNELDGIRRDDKPQKVRRQKFLSRRMKEMIHYLIRQMNPVKIESVAREEASGRSVRTLMMGEAAVR